MPQGLLRRLSAWRYQQKINRKQPPLEPPPPEPPLDPPLVEPLLVPPPLVEPLLVLPPLVVVEPLELALEPPDVVVPPLEVVDVLLPDDELPLSGSVVSYSEPE